jgi:muramidase (phage lysozyme)
MSGISNPFFFIGVIENNIDERLEGRVQVRAFGLHGTVQEVPTQDLPWAVLVHGSYDPNAPIPPLNSWVFGFFLDGRDAQQPMILGLIPTQMTEPIDPVKNGWGVIPTTDGDVTAAGSRPEDFGQPANSRLGRGEYIEETYVPFVEANRKTGIEVPNIPGAEPWEEPGSAYGAQYPYNRVIQTAGGHSIELDDTPGAERIMIYHKSGSYIQVDSRGTTTNKATSDKFDLTETNSHVYIGGKSLVTIEGDSYVLVKGSKTEEILGDYVQNVHGNHMISVGGQMNLNASDEIQQRAAKIRIQGNVEGVSIKAAKNIKIQSGESMHLKSGIAIFQEATNSVNMKAGNNIFIEADGEGNIKASRVNIDEIVNMANGDADSATPADPAEAAEMPEPVSKGTSSADYRNTSSVGTNGYAATDETNSGGANNDGTDQVVGDISAATEGLIKPLLDFIGNLESSGYDTIFGGISRSDYPNQSLTQMTIQQVLNWQDSIDDKYKSEAVGRYQFLEDTLRSIYSRVGLSPTDLFSPANQDKLAIYQFRVRGLDRYLAGSITAENFANNLAKEWASLPVVSGSGAGKSYYAGDSVGNKSLTGVSAFLNLVTELKTNYDAQGSDALVSENTGNFIGPQQNSI